MNRTSKKSLTLSNKPERYAIIDDEVPLMCSSNIKRQYEKWNEHNFNQIPLYVSQKVFPSFQEFSIQFHLSPRVLLCMNFSKKRDINCKKILSVSEISKGDWWRIFCKNLQFLFHRNFCLNFLKFLYPLSMLNRPECIKNIHFLSVKNFETILSTEHNPSNLLDRTNFKELTSDSTSELKEGNIHKKKLLASHYISHVYCILKHGAYNKLKSITRQFCSHFLSFLLLLLMKRFFFEKLLQLNKYYYVLPAWFFSHEKYKW